MQRNFTKIAVLLTRLMATTARLAAVTGLTIPNTVTMAYAKYDLPPPYVSKALGAVLVPINHETRHRYQIPPKLRGVYVLAVSPHGVAAKQGIRPGDVLATVRSRPIVVPIDVDRFVWAALAVSATSFLFGVNRGIEATDIVQINTNITVANFNTTINYNNINSWTSIDNRSDWTQIVNQYNTNINTSIVDNSYRSETNINNDGIPEPGQNFDGTNRTSDDVPEPGQNFDGTNRSSGDIPEPGQNFDGTNRTSDDVPEPGQNFDGTNRSSGDIPEPGQSNLSSTDDNGSDDGTDDNSSDDGTDDDSSDDGTDDNSPDDGTDDNSSDDGTDDDSPDDGADDDSSDDGADDDSSDDGTDDNSPDDGTDDNSSDDGADDNVE
ncbi:hypothetical protein [Brucella pituitosa]|uniref:hypothetical protein n=1 Tax=Brucella pituitosa TaxID=571256 RepID=UPI003F4A85DF